LLQFLYIYSFSNQQTSSERLYRPKDEAVSDPVDYVIFILSIIFSIIFTYLEAAPKTSFRFQRSPSFFMEGFYMSLPASFLINGTAAASNSTKNTEE
jgi:hypothetical protein